MSERVNCDKNKAKPKNIEEVQRFIFEKLKEKYGDSVYPKNRQTP